MSPDAWMYVFLLVGLASTPTHGRGLDRRDEQDKNAIQDMVAYMTALFTYYENDRNVTGLRALYADDVIWMPHGAPTTHGFENAKAILVAYHQLGRLDVQIDEVRPMDTDAEYIYVRSTFQVLDEQDGTVLMDAKGLVIAKKTKNTELGYKITIAIFNKNN